MVGRREDVHPAGLVAVLQKVVVDDGMAGRTARPEQLAAVGGQRGDKRRHIAASDLRRDVERQVLGEDEMAGSRVQPPDRQIEASTTIDAGGRRLALIHPGWASSPGDLVVRDLHSGVIFAGTLVSVGRVPELRDGDPAGWRNALADLQALARAQGDRIVPGYGPPVPAAALDTVRDYIADTEARVRSLFDAGTPLSAIVHAAHLPRYAGWAMYEPVHGRNVQQRYLALERATLAE